MVTSVERQPAVGFFAPSGYLTDPKVIDRAAAWFQDRQWHVSAGDSVFSQEHRFAGPDALRLADLQAFAAGQGLDVAVAARGGYGLSRLLGQIDYDAIATAQRPVIGYSDFTAFNLALLARSGGVSFQGPAASDFYLPRSRRGLPPEQRAASVANQADFLAAMTQQQVGIEFDLMPGDWSHADESFAGTLWGGNLTMICSLLGTPYFPRVRGGILFLEDVNEPAYRIERLLLQLVHAGVLQQQRLVLLGDFSGMPVLSNDQGYTVETALQAVRAHAGVPPLIRGLPFGHAWRRCTLPVGVKAKVELRRTDAPDGARASLRYRGHPRLPDHLIPAALRSRA
jgi:muramoyltetrapeptide carboxypeptidase